MKVLVTGALGFVGSHLAEYLLKQGYEIIGVDLPSAPRDFVIPGIKYFFCDLSDAEKTNKLFVQDIFKDVKKCFHLAAFFDFTFSRDIIINNNVWATDNMCRYFADVDVEDKVFVLYSSGAIYDDTYKKCVADENFPVYVRTAYAHSKLLQELALIRFFSKKPEAFNPIILRPAAIVGPRSRYGAAKIFEGIAKGWLQFFVGRKNLRSALVDIEDMVRATHFLSNYDWQELQNASNKVVPVFNVVNSSKYTFEELMLYLADVLYPTHNSKIYKFHMPILGVELAAFWQNLLVSWFGGRPKLSKELGYFFKYEMAMTSKLLKSLGFEFLHNNKNAIARAADWYIKEGWA